MPEHQIARRGKRQMSPDPQFHGIIPRAPGVNSHVLTVGAPDFPLGYGFPVDFTSVGAVTDAVLQLHIDVPQFGLRALRERGNNG